MEVNMTMIKEKLILSLSLFFFPENMVLSTELIMYIGHCEGFLKLTFRALALRLR